MGIFFSDKTEAAVELLYAQYEQAGFERAAGLLTEAAKEGDADALYFLHRCLMGSRFIQDHAEFEVDEKRAKAVLKESIEKGSALGVIGALRAWGLSMDMKMSMPFRNIKEAWTVVYKKAEAGQPFCQYLVGGAYYWGDMLDIEGISHAELHRRRLEYQQTGVDWYEKAVRNGYTGVAANLLTLLQYGEDQLQPNLPKYQEILALCVKSGDPLQTSRYADDLNADGQYDEALKYYQIAAEKGLKEAYNGIAVIYENGKGSTVKDETYAAECYRKAAAAGCASACGNLGQMLYWQDHDSKDWGEVFYWLDKAVAHQQQFIYELAAMCYIKGLGTPKDYQKALKLLEKADDCRTTNLALGLLYADGLGVPEDIEKGAKFLTAAKKAGSKEAAAKLAQFKKTLLGKWRRR